MLWAMLRITLPQGDLVRGGGRASRCEPETVEKATAELGEQGQTSPWLLSQNPSLLSADEGNGALQTQNP